MPTDERPLRDVLREVEETAALGPVSRDWLGASVRLARELRALAPLLRRLSDPVEERLIEDMRVAQALAEELEEK